VQGVCLALRCFLFFSAINELFRRGALVLKIIYLKIGDGMFGLLRPNGAGKTTLLSILDTLIAPCRTGRRPVRRVGSGFLSMPGRTSETPETMLHYSSHAPDNGALSAPRDCSVFSEQSRSDLHSTLSR
jgi:energy-coupling factor transporter ATP-binding protein EcfA2